MSLPAFVADLLVPGDPDALVFPDSEGGYMRGSNVRRRWWSQAVAAAELFPRTVSDAAGEQTTTVYDFKLHELGTRRRPWRSRRARTSRRCRTCWDMSRRA